MVVFKNNVEFSIEEKIVQKMDGKSDSVQRSDWSGLESSPNNNYLFLCKENNIYFQTIFLPFVQSWRQKLTSDMDLQYFDKNQNSSRDTLIKMLIW